MWLVYHTWMGTIMAPHDLIMHIVQCHDYKNVYYDILLLIAEDNVAIINEIH